MTVLSVIAPCFNEEGNVPVLVARTIAHFDAHPLDAELVLVDDGSRDRTWERIEAEAAAEPRVRGVRHERNKGIEGGWHSGLEHARGDLVCLIDSDLQNRPEDIGRLYDAFVQARPGGRPPDMVQAVRNPKHVHSRRVFSRGLNHLLNVSFGTSLRDNKSGFVLCRREDLYQLLQHRFRYRYFQSFIGAAAGVRKFNIVEVDTEFEPRHTGTSFLSDFPLKVSLKVCVELVKYRIETLGVNPRR
jgi:phenylacetate-CoA ligase